MAPVLPTDKTSGAFSTKGDSDLASPHLQPRRRHHHWRFQHNQILRWDLCHPIPFTMKILHGTKLFEAPRMNHYHAIGQISFRGSQRAGEADPSRYEFMLRLCVTSCVVHGFILRHRVVTLFALRLLAATSYHVFILRAFVLYLRLMTPLRTCDDFALHLCALCLS